MFYYKTAFCPFNLTKHDPSKCVYAHNWQDYRRPPNMYNYQPVVFISLFSLASIGRPKTTSQSLTTPVVARSDITAICVMVGRNRSITLHTTKLSNVKLRGARRDLVLTITLRNREGLLRVKLSIMLSNMCPKTELFREFSKVLSARKASSLSLRQKLGLLFSPSS